MSIALAEKTELRIPAPELRGASWEVGSCRDTEIVLDGPGGTGKTFGILYKIHMLLLSYPGAKWLVCRKFNVDLGGSALATYRDDILHPSEGVRYFGGSRDRPPGYIYPNGSFMAISGLDRPSRLKSFECDGVYINEATEVDIDDLEIARMRLRKGVIPYQQIVMDTNPDAPTHWLNQRMNEGRTTRLLSRHEDNPRYWDNVTQDWTEAGRNYIFGILGGLTGVRYARYRLGLWVAAEGTVYEQDWDRARNVIDRFPVPREWPRYLCVDFGYTNPFCCKWYAMDNDGRLFCYREIYKTKTLVEDHAKQIKHHSRWGLEGGDPLPREIICDHDAEDRATLERHLGLITRHAHKTVRDGIQATAARYRAAGDGKPRLSHFRDALVERDQDLVRQKKPTCTIEEPESYVWAENTLGIKEEPVKEDDHGMDTDRYMVARFDLKPTTVRYSQRVY
jgi:PBSX family phage terminase large subunit